MGLHAPFGYVGYEWQMPKLACDTLELLCQGCHTNSDYNNGCHGCPAGVFFYACKEYVMEAWEEDKHFGEYAGEAWQKRREEMYGHRDSPEEIAKWQKMADYHKPEARAIRKLKRLFKKLEPCPYWQQRGEDVKFDFTEHRKAIAAIKAFQEKMMAEIHENLKKWEERKSAC